jgi:hypothetical protein
MRQRNVRHRFDFFDPEDTQIGLPWMKLIQRIMVRTQIFRQSLRWDGSIEHPAQRDSIHGAAVNRETDDASCELVHHNQDPVCSQYRRFASKQIQGPQRVLGMTDKRQPGRTSRSGFRMEVHRQNPAHHVFVDLDAEGQCDLLSDSFVSPAGALPVLGSCQMSLRSRRWSSMAPHALDLRQEIADMAQRRIQWRSFHSGGGAWVATEGFSREASNWCSYGLTERSGEPRVRPGRRQRSTPP